MLRGNQLIGFGAGAKKPASVAYVARTEVTTPGTVVTFTGQTLGAPAPGRKVVVGVATTGTFSATTMTLAGVAMTRLAFDARVAFFALDESALSTANLVLTNANTLSDGAGIFVWNVFDGASAPLTGGVDTSLTSAHLDLTLACPQESVLLAVAMYKDAFNADPTFTWTGLTERADYISATTRMVAHTAADGTFAVATSQAIQAQATHIIGASEGSLLAIVL